MTNLGSLYFDLGQPAMATQHFEEALVIKKRMGDAKGEGKELIWLAKVRAAQGRYYQALKTLAKAIETWEEIEVPTKWPRDLMANIYLDMGHVEKAEPLLNESGYRSTKGRLCLMKGDYNKAKNIYEDLLKSSDNTGAAQTRFIAHTGLGTVYENLGDYELAPEYYRKAIMSLEQIRSGPEPSQRATFYNTSAGGFSRTEPYEGLSRTLMRLNKQG